MSLHIREEQSGVIVIGRGSRLTIENSAEFQRILVEHLNTNGSLRFEFENNVEMDLTGLQLLCAACRTAGAKGLAFEFTSTRPAFMDKLISSAGLTHHAVCLQIGNSACPCFGGVS